METFIHYTTKIPNLEHEKAFSTDFPVDHVKGARRRNTEPDNRLVTVLPITDPEHWKLDKHGFCVLQGHAHVDPNKIYDDKAAVQGEYWRELEAILHREFPQYSRIECFDLTVRSLPLPSEVCTCGPPLC